MHRKDIVCIKIADEFITRMYSSLTLQYFVSETKMDLLLRRRTEYHNAAAKAKRMGDVTLAREHLRIRKVRSMSNPPKYPLCYAISIATTNSYCYYPYYLLLTTCSCDTILCC